MRELVINWGVNAFTGWGLVGMNLCGLLANDPDFKPIAAARPIDPNDLIGCDPLRFTALSKVMEYSREYAGCANKYADIWIDPIGNDLRGFQSEARCRVARVIVEKPHIQVAQANLASYDLLLTASTWNQEILEDATGRPVKMIHEGIDPALFCPGPKSGWLPKDCFYIYSSGKVEFRKAQDVVLLAFKRFSARHPEARLVTCWNSPFADLANGYRGLCDEPLWLNDKGALNVHRWAHDNGVDATKVLDLGCFPNFVLPQILREMDVMLAPSRIESCTSLPVKEAMACGVPVIYGWHSGMKDLSEHSFPLKNCKPIRASTEYFFPTNDIDWYESDPDEIDQALEEAYDFPGSCTGCEFVRYERTWESHVEDLKEWLACV